MTTILVDATADSSLVLCPCQAPARVKFDIGCQEDPAEWLQQIQMCVEEEADANERLQEEPGAHTLVDYWEGYKCKQCSAAMWTFVLLQCLVCIDQFPSAACLRC